MTDFTERTHTETVLLVDDDPLVRLLILRALKTQGFTVLEARNGSHALDVANEHAAPIHIVISDIVMPDMDGTELFRTLRGWYPNIRFLFISGQMTGADADTSPDGRTAFLPKPFSVDTLLAYMQHVLAATAPPVSSDRFAFLPRP
jgi:CheY-like chemotaxis protein